MTLIGPEENNFSREKVIISYGPDETEEVMASLKLYYSGGGCALLREKFIHILRGSEGPNR